MTISEITFSPTGGTRRVADILAHALGNDIRTIDLADPHFDASATLPPSSDEVAVIAAPAYAGRMPGPAAERIAQLDGNGARAVIVCVYGNRAYDDTLAQLQDVAQKAGFTVIAAVAAIAEHSVARRYATGRPDGDDKAALEGFAAQIAAKLASGDDTCPQVPGHVPSGETGRLGMIPHPTRACNQCGTCAAQCPVQAIDPGDVKAVDRSRCISCMRCVAICPRSARRIGRIMQFMVNRHLKKVCSTRRSPQLFL